VGTSGALFASLIGIMAVTSEFRHGTIRSTFVVCPRRGRVMLAKVAASLVLGLVFGVLAEGLALGIGLAVIRGRGVDLQLDAADIRGIVLGAIAMTMLFAALGVGIGGVVRNQVFAVIGLLVWLLVVESILFGVVPSVGRFAPGKAAAALVGTDQSHLLSTAAGGLVLLGWVVVFVLAGSVVTARRDVT
jgi:ABC-2 type transport system permease protein